MDLSTSVSVPPVSTKRDTLLQSRVTSWQTKGVGSYIAYSGKLKKYQSFLKSWYTWVLAVPRWFARLLVVLNHRTHVSAYSHCEHHYEILNISAYAIWYPHSFSCIMLVNIHNTTYSVSIHKASLQFFVSNLSCNYIGSRDFVWTHTGHSVHDLMNNIVSNS